MGQTRAAAAAAVWENRKKEGNKARQKKRRKDREKERDDEGKIRCTKQERLLVTAASLFSGSMLATRTLYRITPLSWTWLAFPLESLDILS